MNLCPHPASLFPEIPNPVTRISSPESSDFRLVCPNLPLLQHIYGGTSGEVGLPVLRAVSKAFPLKTPFFILSLAFIYQVHGSLLIWSIEILARDVNCFLHHLNQSFYGKKLILFLIIHGFECEREESGLYTS